MKIINHNEIVIRRFKNIYFTSSDTKSGVFSQFHVLLGGTSSKPVSISCIGYYKTSSATVDIVRIQDDGDGNIDFERNNGAWALTASSDSSEYLEGDLSVMFLVP